MSYTTRDYISDMREPLTEAQLDEFIECGLCVIRRSDMETLVQVARDHGLDPDIEENWQFEGDRDALLALANWQKEHRDWEPET